MSISLKLNEIILQRKTRKVDLYNHLGISKKTLDDYLSEKTSMTVATLGKIAAYFNVPVTYFFDEKEPLGTNIKGSKNQVGNGNIIIDTSEIEHLKQLLTEKERTIQILMKKK